MEFQEKRRSIAGAAFEFIVNVARPHVTAGGSLHSKGSRGIPRQVRLHLEKLDRMVPVLYSSPSALAVPIAQRIVEHVVPIKRIAIEIIDPSKADPRSNESFSPIADGPAKSPDHLLEIFDTLICKCRVTRPEHDRLNRVAPSTQWDAPNGDGWQRYRLAEVEVVALTEPDRP